MKLHITDLAPGFDYHIDVLVEACLLLFMEQNLVLLDWWLGNYRHIWLLILLMDDVQKDLFVQVARHIDLFIKLVYFEKIWLHIIVRIIQVYFLHLIEIRSLLLRYINSFTLIAILYWSINLRFMSVGGVFLVLNQLICALNLRNYLAVGNFELVPFGEEHLLSCPEGSLTVWVDHIVINWNQNFIL